MKRLFKLAFITSPIIALYGVVPIFLVIRLNVMRHAIGFLLLSVLILLFWVINLYLLGKLKQSTARYLVSFLVTFVLHSTIFFLIPKFANEYEPVNFFIYALFSTLAINCIILIMINSELMRQKKERAESEIQELKVESLEAQKQVLIQQLHPHFLFNALSTLKSLIRKDQREAEDYSVKLSEFLRYSIQSHSSQLVTLESELQFARDYLDLQKVRFGNALYCEIAVGQDVFNRKLPVFALQALVENAIKHNSFTEKKPLSIRIEIQHDRLKVTNNKIPKPLLQSPGTGLKNLSERYRLLSLPPVEIVNDQHYFIVLITLLEL